MDPISCGPCKRDTLQVPAAKWCRDCQEGLCDACLRYHRKIKHTMEHRLHDNLESETHAKLFASFDQLLASCPACNKQRHATKVCTEHRSVCCDVCREENHHYCTDIHELADILCGKVKLDGDTPSSFDISSLKGVTDDVLKQLDLPDEVKSALGEIEDINKSANESIDRTKAIIDQVFDRLAKHFRVELKQNSDDAKKELNQAIQAFEDKITLFKNLKEVFAAIDEDGNKNCLEILKYFCSLKGTELQLECLDRTAKKVESLFDEGTAMKGFVDKCSLMEHVMEHLPRLETMPDITARAVVAETGKKLQIELKDDDEVFMTVTVNENFFKN